MAEFVYVCDEETNRDGGVELPAEEDGTLLISVLQSQFEGAIGLKYRNPTSGCWRAIKRVGEVLHPPDTGWGEAVYVAVTLPSATSNTTVPPPVEEVSVSEGEVPSVEVQAVEGEGGGGGGGGGEGGGGGDVNYKRKMEDEGSEEERSAKNPRSASPDFTSLKVHDLNREDLIILGLQWSVTDSELRRYFEQFGEVAAAEVKKDHATGKSRGFGFVRFFDSAVQDKVQSMQHTINERRIDIKHPRKSPSYMPCKLFVGCLPIKPEATKEELEEYFRPFGEISDVYIPKPYRGFGFVTFQEGNDVQKVLSQTHRLRHSTLNITHADPKGAPRRPPAPVQTGGGGGGGGGGGAVTANYGYGYGSQFYNPQPPQPQGVYYSYGTPQQTAQYNFSPRGYAPQQQQPRGAMSPGTQPYMEQYQQQQPLNDIPPPAKRPHQVAGGPHVTPVVQSVEQQYGGHYGQGASGGGGAEVVGMGAYGTGSRYRGGGGWTQ